MNITAQVHPAFCEGDEVVLTKGTYEGTPGVFLRLKEDTTWGPTSPSEMAVSAATLWLGSPIPKLRSVALRRDAGVKRTNKAASQMDQRTRRAIQAWEDEGGAASPSLDTPVASLTGTAAQVEWAELIRTRVDAEFDGVVACFRAIAERHSGEKRADTEAIIAIVEDKRHEVLERGQAGYFIHDWQDISDQVRQMIFHDARYQAIKSRRPARPRRP
jgi:hypothetical protein